MRDLKTENRELRYRLHFFSSVLSFQISVFSTDLAAITHRNPRRYKG